MDQPTVPGADVSATKVADGTSLPRRNTIALAVGYAIGCLILCGLPVFLLGQTLNMRGFTELFAGGGPVTYLLPTVEILVLLLFAVLAFFAIAGQSIPAAVLFVPALVPVALGLIGTARDFENVQRALDVVAPEMRAVLLAKGLSESLGPLALGALESGFALFAAALLFALSQLAIDTRRLKAVDTDNPVGSQSRSSGAALALILALMALAVSIGSRFLLGQGLIATDLAVFAALVLPVVYAPLAASSLMRLPENEAGVTAWRNAAHVIPALAGAVTLIGFAGIELARLRGLGTVAGVSPEFKATLMAQLAAEIRMRPQMIAIDVACAAAASGLVLLRAPRPVRRPHPLGASSLITIGATLAVALGLVWFARIELRTIATQEEQSTRLLRDDVQLPVNASPDLEVKPGPSRP